MIVAYASFVPSPRQPGHVHRVGVATLALLVMGVVAGCEVQGPAGPRVRAGNVWSRPALAMAHGTGEGRGMGTTGVVYLTLVNEGREADRLIGAHTTMAATVELHQTTLEGGVMKMGPVVEGLSIPAGGRVELKPGGLHLMLIGLQQHLKAGDRFAVVLTFEKSGTITVKADVRQP